MLFFFSSLHRFIWARVLCHTQCSVGRCCHRGALGRPSLACLLKMRGFSLAFHFLPATVRTCLEPFDAAPPSGRFGGQAADSAAGVGSLGAATASAMVVVIPESKYTSCTHVFVVASPLIV